MLPRLRHVVELEGRWRSHATDLLLSELCSWVELEVKALHGLRSVPTTALVPSGVRQGGGPGAEGMSLLGFLG